MFLTGDSTITPRMVLDRGWRLTIWCEKCRRSTGPALKTEPWPRLYDVPLLKLYPRLTCSNLVERRGRMVKCGTKTTQLVVSKIVGSGSQTEEVLRLAERLE